MKFPLIVFLVVANFLSRAQCNNIDFESTTSGAYSLANSVSGWIINSGVMTGCTGENWVAGASEFSVATTPLAGFPGVGTLPHSPLGGTQIALLNNSINNYSKTKISSTFTVTPSNNILDFAFAGTFLSPGGCCDGVGLYIKLTGCGNIPIDCGTYTQGPSCGNSGTTFQTTGGMQWTSWVTKTVDLTAYTGTCVTLEVWCTDNAFGGQYARAAFDARCRSVMGPGALAVSGISPVNFCSGSNIAQLTAPPGYSSYSWTAASTLVPVTSNQATLASITVSNPVAGGFYTVVCSNPSVCSTSYVYSLATTQVSIGGISVKSSCPAGSSGSATVFATGSSMGYIYGWFNGVSTISNASVVSGLSPGNYTVTALAGSTVACGSASITLLIPSGTVSPAFSLASYCSNMAYVTAPPGSNYQWYSGSSAISGATLTGITYTNPATAPPLSLGYTNSGCRDSIIFSMQPIQPGQLLSVASGSGCAGVIGGTASFSFFPLSGSPSTPGYTFSVPGPTPVTMQSGTFAGQASVTGLTYGATYSITAFDGVCYSGTQVVVAPLTPSFSILPTLPGTVCSGNTINLSASVSPPGSKYTFSWSPPVFVNGQSNLQTISVTPTVAPGNSATLIYTVVVTPTAANCPQQATLALQYIAPPTPAVTVPQPSFCTGGMPANIISNPPGGTLTPFSSGVIVPSQLSPGSHTIQYAVSAGNCISTASASFLILPSPIITVLGDSAVCPGDIATITATGADIYSWHNSAVFISGQTATVFPTSGYSLIAQGTSTLTGCTGTAVTLINLLTVPVIAVAGRTLICEGESLVLSASGASTYSWTGLGSGNSVTVAPMQSNTYTVTGIGTENNCGGHALFSVTVTKCLLTEEQHQIRKTFPNPTPGMLWIFSDRSGFITVTDLNGKVMLRVAATTGLQYVDISMLDAGTYYVRTEGSLAEKIILTD